MKHGVAMPIDAEDRSKHFQNSLYREKLIEHLFVGELLKHSWFKDNCSLEIAKPEVDNAGYDLIAEAHGVVRHIQIKTPMTTSKTALQKVHVRLAEKPSGCVVWIVFDAETLAFQSFRFFGDAAGESLPSLAALKVGKHTKGDSENNKAERPNIRVIPKRQFEELTSIEEVYRRLFGSHPVAWSC